LFQISSATFAAKYYLNWFSFHAVIMKVIGVNFFWNTVYIGVQSAW